MASLMPPGKQQYFDATGHPLAGGKLYTYAAGTSSLLSTYQDKAGTILNTNPVILDSRGEASVFWGSAGYKVVLKDALDTTIWTQDNLFSPATASDLAAHEALMASSSGSNLVGYLPAGTGAVSTTVQTKLRESVSVLDKGAIGDNVTNDLAAFTSASIVPFYAPVATYKIATTLSLPANSRLIGDGRKNTILNAQDATNAVDISSGSLISDVAISATSSTKITAASASDIVLDSVGLSGNYAFHANASGLNNVSILDSVVTGTDAFGILFNSGCTNGYSIRIAGNTVSSATGDPIELNFPSCNFKYSVVYGNILTNPGGTGVTAGFGIGVAAAESGTYVANVVTNSTANGLHFEDSQKNNTIVGNVVHTRGTGLFVAVPAGGLSVTTPLPVVGNQFVKGTPSNGANVDDGIHLQTTNATQSGMALVANRASGFTTGLYLGAGLSGVASTITLADNNIIENCTYGIGMEGYSGIGECRQYGVNYAKTVVYAFHAISSGAAFGKMVAKDSFGGLILKPAGGYAGGMPSVCDGWAMPANITYPYTINPGANTIVITSGMGRVFGRIRAKGIRTGTTDWFYASATILFDGTTLTVTNPMTAFGTNFTAATFSVTNAGAPLYLFNVVLTSTGASQLNSLSIEFDGEWMDY